MNWEVGKRSSNKVKVDYASNDMYRWYNKQHKKGSELKVPVSTYTKIIGLFNKKIMDKVLYESESVNLPCNMGTISVAKYPMKKFDSKLHIDWPTSVKLKKYVYHMNDHTDNYQYRFMWHRNKMRVLNSRKYYLTFSRTNKRLLAKLIKDKDNNIDYFSI